MLKIDSEQGTKIIKIMDTPIMQLASECSWSKSLVMTSTAKLTAHEQMENKRYALLKLQNRSGFECQ